MTSASLAVSSNISALPFLAGELYIIVGVTTSNDERSSLNSTGSLLLSDIMYVKSFRLSILKKFSAFSYKYEKS